MTARADPITRAASLAADSLGRLIRRAAQGNAEAVAEVVSLPADLRGLGRPFEVLVDIIKRMDGERRPITEDAVLEEVIILGESGVAHVLLDHATPPTHDPARCAGHVRDFLRAVERDALTAQHRAAVLAGDDGTDLLERLVSLEQDGVHGLKFAGLGDLSELADAPLPWLVDGWLLSGNVTLLAAPGGVGKSMLSLALAASVVHGRALINGMAPLAQGAAVMLSYEDNRTAVAKRLRALQRHHKLDGEGFEADLDKHLHLLDDPRPLAEVDRAGNVRPTAFYTELAATVRRMQPRLVVVDTLRRAGGALDGNAAAHIGELLSLLGDLARESGAAVLVLAHVRKGTGKADAGAENVRGSSAATDEARGAWELRKTADGNLELHITKTNFSGDQNRLHLRVVPVGDAACLESIGGPVANDPRDVEAAVMRWFHANPETVINPNGVIQGKGAAGGLVSAVLASVTWARHRDVEAAVNRLIADKKLNIETTKKANRHKVEALRPVEGVFDELYTEEEGDVPF
ncbi:MAG: AAA family ATPase [Candidatus Hydrogenedentes bacterium]|nr:AAA family ATPase [Candidatus Hydrogenedentota bacterium]